MIPESWFPDSTGRSHRAMSSGIEHIDIDYVQKRNRKHFTAERKRELSLLLGSSAGVKRPSNERTGTLSLPGPQDISLSAEPFLLYSQPNGDRPIKKFVPVTSSSLDMGTTSRRALQRHWSIPLQNLKPDKVNSYIRSES